MKIVRYKLSKPFLLVIAYKTYIEEFLKTDSQRIQCYSEEEPRHRIFENRIPEPDGSGRLLLFFKNIKMVKMEIDLEVKTLLSRNLPTQEDF